MRTVDVSEVTRNIKEMCIEANYFPFRGHEGSYEKSGGYRESASWKKNIRAAAGKTWTLRGKIGFPSARIREWQ